MPMLLNLYVEQHADADAAELRSLAGSASCSTNAAECFISVQQHRHPALHDQAVIYLAYPLHNAGITLPKRFESGQQAV